MLGLVSVGEQGGGRCTGGGRRGAGSGIPKVREAGEKGKIMQRCAIFRNRKKCNEAGANKYTAETGVKG